MEKILINIGMVGAGRATELHMGAYRHVKDVTPVYRAVISSTYEKAQAAKELYGFGKAYHTLDELIADPKIDVIDICTPPSCHAEAIIKALNAGKHVICEKPMTGYFGEPDDPTPIGTCVSKTDMYRRLMRNMEELKTAVANAKGHFMYAENFVYAPAVQKMAEIIAKKKSRILCLKGEESLKGSSSPVAGSWCKTGGGTFTRTGGHPLSAVLWLKQVEARARGVNIVPESVVADMGYITQTLSEYEHRHIMANPIDVEDFGVCTITFSDKTKAIIIATDTLLGGSRNYVEAYCNDAVLMGNLTLNDMMSTYFLDEERLDDVYLSEMLPSKLGWNKPFIVDEIVRGYVDEMQDFMEAAAYDRPAASGFSLAYDAARLTYAAYLSAETGRRIHLNEGQAI